MEVKTMAEDTAALTRQSEELYQRYVKPLEKDHQGEYIAVSEDGRIVLASTLPELLDKAEQDLPPGNFLFKVGDIAIDTWR
jgi:hypothetical protein